MRKPVRYRSHESRYSWGGPCKGAIHPGRQSAAGEANESCYPNKRKCRTAHGGDRQNKPHGSDFPWGFGSVRFYASHSDLWASHHAGKAGSFGERVGLMVSISINVELVLLSNMDIKGCSSLIPPKYKNSSNMPLLLVQTLPD